MTCRACYGSTETVFEMEPMPLAGAFAQTREEALAAPKYPLRWEWCTRCGLVNVEPDIPGDVIFADYSYRASDVPALVRHHQEFAGWLVRRYGTDPLRMLEIGGNDGVLLRQLPAVWDKTNVDPSDVAAAIPGTDWLVVQREWPAASALHGFYDLVTSSNAFAHFSEIGAGLAAVREALAPGGEFVMEVHDLDATLALGQWDTIYHEHKAEWSMDAIIRAATIYGFTIVSSQRLPLHGGLIRAVLRPIDNAVPPSKPRKPPFDRLQKAYDDRTAPQLPAGTWAYGAAARATVYLNQTGVTVDAIVDGSPRRAGRYVPGTGTPIVSPEAFDEVQPPACLITAWNHAYDITARHHRYKNWFTVW